MEQELAEDYGISGKRIFTLFLNGLIVGRLEGPPPAFSPVLRTVPSRSGSMGMPYQEMPAKPIVLFNGECSVCH